jgi:hypothetical protein
LSNRWIKKTNIGHCWILQSLFFILSSL